MRNNHTVDLTLLLPLSSHPAIEERYASWQSEMLLRRSTENVVTLRYDPSQPIRDIVDGVTTSHVLVATTPLFVCSDEIATQLHSSLDSASAAVPVCNESDHPRQKQTPVEPYLTLRQFQEVAARMSTEAAEPHHTTWTDADPTLYLARTDALRMISQPARSALSGLETLVVPAAYIHRYASHRGQLRTDILARIPTSARSILEFGCGEAALGAALKQRQECRVVGIELDPEAAAIAKTRIDAVHSGDVRELVDSIGETFDWIVGGDILEHLDEPWTFLTELKKLTAPGGHLILSLPNVSAWPIVADLLRGRFDYVYMGILCSGHLRFFTRQTIQDMLEISGWRQVAIEPQEPFVTHESGELMAKLQNAGIPHSPTDLTSPGYYVIAQNPPNITS